jgi:hypothetical protein
MYQEYNRVFETPPPRTKIWRYMSFSKFVWLIAEEKLYFSRLDQHTDAWEGMLPQNWETEVKKYARFKLYVNCWHMNSSESDAMWKLYGATTGETVAIKTTVGRLIKALEGSPTPVYMGRVRYDERDRPQDCLYWPVTCKRKPFRHEKELRLCVSSPSANNPPDLSQLKKEFVTLGIDNKSDMAILKEVGEKGIKVRIDLNHLIREVLVCPDSQPSLLDSLEYILMKKVPHARIKRSLI